MVTEISISLCQNSDIRKVFGIVCFRTKQSHIACLSILRNTDCMCRYTVTFVQPNGKQLKKVVELIEAHKLKVPIHKVWKLEQAA